MVLTESAVRKYFGNEDPFGQNLEMGNNRTNYAVTEIIENPKSNSHFSFNVIVSFMTYLIALTTVSFQVYMAARLNPVDTLRDE